MKAVPAGVSLGLCETSVRHSGADYLLLIQACDTMAEVQAVKASMSNMTDILLALEQTALAKHESLLLELEARR